MHTPGSALRQRIGRDEFDYLALSDALSEYKNPREKITRLLRDGTIIRVKKGLYVLGDLFRHRALSREVLANLIHGPSYISLQYAMQYYGLIPEGVHEVTSVTLERSRHFDTPMGRFSFAGVPLAAYRVGFTRIDHGDGRPFLIATAEKALMDMVVLSHDNVRSQADMEIYLVDNLRIDYGTITSLAIETLEESADAWATQRAHLLVATVKKMRRLASKL